MLQKVNTVLVGAVAPAAYTNADALNVGEIALFDENKKVLADAAAAEKASEVYIGVCEGKETVYNEEGTSTVKSVIRYSMPIKKGSKPHAVKSAYVAPAEDKIVITATNVVPEVGHRYVLRLIYPDLYESPNQQPDVYEVIASTTNPNDLMAEFAKRINKRKGVRVVASVSEAVLTLTAKEIPYVDDDYELYRQVSVNAFMWKTIPSGLLSNVTYAINNLSIAKTQGTPGKGNPKIIRDREREAFGYRGITHRGNAVYPYIAPEVKAQLDKTYDSLVIEWDNLYLSNDNQYLKTTPLTTELYVEAGELDGSSKFEAALNAFIAKA